MSVQGPAMNLGFHCTGPYCRQATHGVAAALHAVRLEGGVAGVDFWVEPLYARAGKRWVDVLRMAQQMANEVHAVVGGGNADSRDMCGIEPMLYNPWLKLQALLTVWLRVPLAAVMISQLGFALRNVSQVAYAATSPVLGNQVQFPSFNQVVPADSAQGVALAQVCQKFGWAFVAIVASPDLPGVAASRAFADAHINTGGRVVEEVQLPFATQHDLTAQADEYSTVIDELVSSNARVVALFTSSLDATRRFLSQVGRRILDSPADRPLRITFLGIDTWMDPLLLPISTPELLAALDGSVGTRPHWETSGPAYEQFMRNWVAATTVSQPSLSCDEVCRSRFPLPWIAAYAYDATRLAVSAWAAIVRRGGDPSDLTSGVLLSGIRHTTLAASLTIGNLTLDPATGERSIPYY